MLRVLADQVGYGAHGDGRGEAVRLADDPVGHIAAIRAAADAQAGGVDRPCPLDYLIERGHEIDEILAAPVADDLPPEPLAISV